MKKISSLSNPYPEQGFLAEILQQQRFSITRIALELQISKATVSRILNGCIHHTHPAVFAKILSLYCRIFYTADGLRKKG